MSRRRPQAIHHDPLRISLAHALGFHAYPDHLTAEPYLNYISNRNIFAGAEHEYLELLLLVVEHFRANKTVQVLLQQLVDSNVEQLFAETAPGSAARIENVEDTVMYIMGVRAMMLSSFVRLPNGIRKVIMAYNINTGGKVAAFEESLPGLIKSSGLLPMPESETQSHINGDDEEVIQTARKLIALLSQTNISSVDLKDNAKDQLRPTTSSIGIADTTRLYYRDLQDMDSLESLSIKATRLNAFTLNTLGAVDVSWTHNISRHMLLSQRRGRYVLEVFAMPCIFEATSSAADQIGVSPDLAQEIQESYGILFNAWPDMPTHSRIGGYFGLRRICWCWSCSAYRHRGRIISHLRNGNKPISRKRMQHDNHFQSELDPRLLELMCNDEACDWTYELFPSLWSRITILEEHMHKAKPWSIWILLRDRRDTLQFWTFFFATLVVFLTFLQVALGIAQVIGSFQ